MVGFNVACWRGKCGEFFKRALPSLYRMGAESVAFVVSYVPGCEVITDVSPREMGEVVREYSGAGFTVGLKFHLEPPEMRRRYPLDTCLLETVLRYLERTPDLDFVFPFNERTAAYEDPAINDILRGVGKYGPRVGIGLNHDDVRRGRFSLEAHVVGISAYYTVSRRRIPPVEEVLSFWMGMSGEIGRWRRYGKEVWFSEVGYRACGWAGYRPWEYRRCVSPSRRAQANLYEGLLRFLNTREGPDRTLFWVREDVQAPSGYDPCCKEAEGVLRRFTGRTSPRPPW